MMDVRSQGTLCPASVRAPDLSSWQRVSAAWCGDEIVVLSSRLGAIEVGGDELCTWCAGQLYMKR
jgi:hypothetical protein